MLTIYVVSIKEKRVNGSLFRVTSSANKPQYKEVHKPVPACKNVQTGRVGYLILIV